jgi:hypothetical protein
LTAVPIPNANLLWKDLHVQDVRIEIVVEGVTGNRSWTCGIGFEYANEESLYCRPLDNSTSPPEALASRVVFLSPMSGLADREFLKQSGEIEFLIGQECLPSSRIRTRRRRYEVAGAGGPNAAVVWHRTG